MHHFAWRTVVWVLVASSTFISPLCTSAAEVDRSDHVNGFVGKRNKRPSLIQNNGSANTLSHSGNTGFPGVDNEVEGKVLRIESDDNDHNEAGDENQISDLARVRRKYRLTDILVACFFFIAAFWLILACMYSVILLVLLRLQARGELDIYDENLGRVVLYNGRVTLHFGCILRRYAIQLEEVSISIQYLWLCLKLLTFLANLARPTCVFAHVRIINGNFKGDLETLMLKTKTKNPGGSES